LVPDAEDFILLFEPLNLGLHIAELVEGQLQVLLLQVEGVVLILLHRLAVERGRKDIIFKPQEMNRKLRERFNVAKVYLISLYSCKFY